MTRVRRALSATVLGAALLAAVVPTTACTGESLLYVLAPGVINDPSNKKLRFEIMSYGLETFCKQAKDRSTGLRLMDAQPTIGRFMATNCQTQVNQASQTFTLTFSGSGWAWNHLTGRLAFNAGATVRYRPDFHLAGDGMYVYFTTEAVTSTTFQTTMVESSMAQAGMGLTGVNPDALGRKIFEDQLGRGFTVIRYNKAGEVDFGMGVVPKGRKPWHPFPTDGSELKTLANDSTSISPEQQDYITGLQVENSNKALTFTLQLHGPARAEAFLMPQMAAATMLQGFTSRPGPQPPAGPPIATFALQGNQVVKQKVSVPSGRYTLVLDHSRIGTVPADASQAKVDFLVQEGDR